MKQIAQVSEQLSQIATDLRTRMLEIEELRKAVQSAEAAKAAGKSASPDTFQRFVDVPVIGPAARNSPKRAYSCSVCIDRSSLEQPVKEPLKPVRQIGSVMGSSVPTGAGARDRIGIQ